MEVPAISVIIPMYNAEKFIDDCLDSLLAQTFRDFEVIVVDDCSTDSSPKVVESYVPKFGGRMTFTKMKVNSGGGGAPRNKGLLFSCGEYVFFMDADDALTESGLEEMYALAKKFNADVVYCEKYYTFKGTGKISKQNIRVADKNIQQGDFVDEPTLETDNLVERIKKATSWKYWVTPWQRLVLRKLLTENEITFPSLIGSNDMGWAFEVLFCAKRFLRVPNICYIWRIHDNSNTLRPRPINKLIHKWLDRTIRGLKIIDDFMKDMAFFREHQECRYAVLCFFADTDFNSLFVPSLTIAPNVFQQIVREEFTEELGEHDVLVSILAALINTHQRIAQENMQKFNSFATQAQSLIDEPESEVEQIKGINKSVNISAISVIIPMYNSEKYIGECLDSLLAQTFQDFEVIVVDDCSTDDSVVIVESYAQKFSGRLKLAKTEVNSGGGGYVPRNIGLSLASGEYVYFLDADDFIVETALEIFHEATTQFNSDVVYTPFYYFYDTGEKFTLTYDIETEHIKQKGIEEKMTITVDDPHKNLQRLLFEGCFRNPWTKFVRRDFLIENEIVFPKIISGGDFLWSIQVFCHAKRLLTLPVALYFYRGDSSESISRKKRSPFEQITHWVSAFIVWLRSLDELANKTEILRQNPAYCVKASRLHFEYCMNSCLEERLYSSSEKTYEILCRKFADNSLVPFFLSVIDEYQRELLLKQLHIDDLSEKLKAKE